MSDPLFALLIGFGPVAVVALWIWAPSRYIAAYHSDEPDHVKEKIRYAHFSGLGVAVLVGAVLTFALVIQIRN